MAEKREKDSRSVTRTGGRSMILGFVIGSQLLIVYAIVLTYAPIAPLLLAAATAVRPQTRDFALGALAAAVAGFIALSVYFAVYQAAIDMRTHAPYGFGGVAESVIEQAPGYSVAIRIHEG